jgi:PAS domain S-box-containing protein
MSRGKKPYIPPVLKKYSSPSDLPQHVQEGIADITETVATLRVVVDDQRRYHSVSPMFANLLGYHPAELQGKRIDDVTARGTIDIEFAFNAFLRLGEMDGLWVFERRDGKKVLFHYRARRMEDQLCYAELEPLPLAG